MTEDQAMEAMPSLVSGCLIGAKILVAFLVGRSWAFLKSRGYVYVNRILGAVLAGFSIFFLRDGMRFLGFEV